MLTAISNDPQACGWLDLNIVESIRSTNVTAGNVIVVDILDEVKDAVQRGGQVWVTLAKHPLVVPPLASQKVSSARRPASASAGLLVDVGELFGAMLRFRVRRCRSRCVG